MEDDKEFGNNLILKVFINLMSVVRLLAHVHFNQGLLPRDSRVPGQRPPVCSINLTVSLWSSRPVIRTDD